MSEHAWAQENLDAFVAGALSAVECERLERHLQACGECAAAKAEIAEIERLVVGVCARGRPDAGLEDRAIQRLRRAPRPMPSWFRFVSAAAAVFLLGLIGFAVREMAVAGVLPGAGESESAGYSRAGEAEKRLSLFGYSRYVTSEGFIGGTPGVAENSHAQATVKAGNKASIRKADVDEGHVPAMDDILKDTPATKPVQQFKVVDLDPAATEFDKDIRYSLQTLRDKPAEAGEKWPDAGKFYDQPKRDKLDDAEKPPGPDGRKSWSARTPPAYTQPPMLPPNEKPAEKMAADMVEKPAPEAKEPPAQPKPDAKEPLPEKTGRMIIRTGDMEFEVDSFDKARDAIAMLITGVKGGFIATVNRDTLPNGKTKGAVVVRMPPTALDKFILDLRRDLAKFSELKSERLGSLDISKQYTDIESRLRAARAIEDRLINIIKTGKGEIKDLVAAEKELAVWRTKIEEMEGEIRYYANQVGLSTLTISLTEKEIQAPTAIVVTDTVSVRIEVDDVGKAHRAAMKAVEDLMGRITRSEMKQHTAGQFLAILRAEIPPGKKEQFLSELKKLGFLSDHQENQRQHLEGGSGKAPELKPMQADVVFEITLNNTANVRPKVSVELKIAASDVPAAYAKLLEAIAKAKGQIRDGKLNEQDKVNVSAQLDFNVPAGEKAAMDKLIAEIGPVLERVNVQAPISELSTASKFGYVLLLRDMAGIPPGQASEIKLAASDVPGQYAKLAEAVREAKGQISTARLNEQDKLNVSATLHFTVPIEQKAALEKLLPQLGTILSRNNVQAPAAEMTTDRKFGYAISLRDYAAIPARDSFKLELAAADVAGGFRELQDAVAAARGQVFVAQLAEDNKVKMEATLQFDVPAAERQPIEKLLAKIGAVVTRTSSQVPVNEFATDQKVRYLVQIRGIASMPPRETVQAKLEVKDVDAAAADLRDRVAAANGRVLDSNIDRFENGQALGVLKFEVPLAAEEAVLKQLKSVGTLVSQQAKRNPQVAENALTTAHIIVVLAGTAPIVPSDEGLGSYVRTSLLLSFRVFAVCVMLIILGVSAVLPWALVIWLAYKAYVRWLGPRSVSLPGPPPPGAPAAG